MKKTTKMTVRDFADYLIEQRIHSVIYSYRNQPDAQLMEDQAFMIATYKTATADPFVHPSVTLCDGVGNILILREICRDRCQAVHLWKISPARYMGDHLQASRRRQAQLCVSCTLGGFGGDGMSIREQSAAFGFEIVGQLTRRPEWERARPERAYIDEAGNEYYTRRGVLTIVTADGAVI